MLVLRPVSDCSISSDAVESSRESNPSGVPRSLAVVVSSVSPLASSSAFPFASSRSMNHRRSSSRVITPQKIRYSPLRRLYDRMTFSRTAPFPGIAKKQTIVLRNVVAPVVLGRQNAGESSATCPGYLRRLTTPLAFFPPLRAYDRVSCRGHGQVPN